MKKIQYFNFVVIFVFIVLTLCELFVGDNKFLTCFALILTLLLPILFKLLKVDVCPVLELIYLIFIIVVQFFGSVLNFYNSIWWYDLFAHFFSGIVIPVFAIFLMIKLNNYNERNILFNLLFIFGFVFFTACMWEFFEFGCDIFLGMNTQHSIDTGVSDTMQDLLIAFLGSLIFNVCYIYEIKCNRVLFLRKLISYI